RRTTLPITLLGQRIGAACGWYEAARGLDNPPIRRNSSCHVLGRSCCRVAGRENCSEQRIWPDRRYGHRDRRRPDRELVDAPVGHSYRQRNRVVDYRRHDRRGAPACHCKAGDGRLSAASLVAIVETGWLPAVGLACEIAVDSPRKSRIL